MNAYLTHIYDDIRHWPELLACAKTTVQNGRHSLQSLLNYDVVNLPVAESLSEAEVRGLVRRMEQIWQSHGIHTVFPRQVPARERYRLIISVWDQPVISFSSQQIAHIHFCHKQLPFCTFGASNCICGAKFKSCGWWEGGPEAA